MHTHPLWRAYEVPTAEEIAAARVRAHVPERIEVVPPDPSWPAQFEQVRALVRNALGERALEIQHVGSTSVAGLPAKPVIDVDVIVADSGREDDYLPALEAVGFELRVREPQWQQHRLLRLPQPLTNLHVWSTGAQEPRRHVAFRAWLESHPDDLAAYAELKRRLGERGFTDAMDYNNEKSGLIYDLYERIFAADPRHPHTPRPR